MDFGNNTKANDDDINSFLYNDPSASSQAASNYSLPSDPWTTTATQVPSAAGSSNVSMRPGSASVEKMAMMNKLKQQQMAQYQRKKTQLTGIKKLNNGSGTMGNGSLTLDQMNLDRKNDFEGDTFDPFKIGMGQGNVDLSL